MLMRKTLLALFSTTAGIAALIGLKAQSAGTPRPALGDSQVATEETAPSTAPTGGTRTPTRGAPAPTTVAPTSAVTGRYTGAAAPTPDGTMQVRAVLDQGKLTDVTVLQQTSGGRSTQIDSYALPLLKTEALRAQSARIDVVSGATYTSSGYARSLQAALDTARR
jgi:uncharacterized protein with FMN-binding domain